MGKKSIEEQIADLAEEREKVKTKVRQLEAQERAFLKRQESTERKKRTHRLIETGAEVESVCGFPIEKSMLPLLRKCLLKYNLRDDLRREIEMSYAEKPAEQISDDGNNVLELFDMFLEEWEQEEFI